LRSALERVSEVGEDEYLEAAEARAAICRGRDRSSVGDLSKLLESSRSLNPLDDCRADTAALELKDQLGEPKVSPRKDAKDSIGGWTEPYLSNFVLFLRISRWIGP
jgi:hypothetical protein